MSARTTSRRDLLRGGGALLAGGLLAGGPLAGCGEARPASSAPGAPLAPGAGARTAVRPIGVAQLTDIHVSLDGPDWLELFQQSRRIFRQAVDELNARADVDLVLMTGDLFEANRPGSGDMDAFLAIAGELRKPWLAMVGNREVDPVPPELCRTKAQVVKLLEGHGYDGQGYCWSYAPAPGWRILALDTTVVGEVHGEVAAESLAWLDDQLRAHASERVLVATHHLLRPTWGELDVPKWKRNYLTRNSAAVTRRLEAAPQVKLAVAGHMHMTHVQVAGGLPYAESPALVQYPHAYRVWRLWPDRVEASWHQVQLPDVVALGRSAFRASAYARAYSADPDAAERWVVGGEADRSPRFALRGPPAG